MAATLAFYRQLGLAIPSEVDDQPHVEADLGSGLRLAFDTEDTVRSFDPAWSPPAGGGHRVALAFACDRPEEVDADPGGAYRGRLPGAPGAVGRLWGMRYAVVHDPDGRPVDLFAPLPPT